MLITKDFVFVHLSKTGGTFVTLTLKDLLCPSKVEQKVHGLRRRFNIKVPFYKYKYKELDQHALCNDIPAVEREKTIVSCVRNPYKLYVSEYTFGWWKKYPEKWFRDLDEVAKAHPDFRQFAFEQFVHASSRFATWVRKTVERHPETANLGWYTHKFVYYYCADHDYVFEAAADRNRFRGRVRDSMYDVHFLRTEFLNNDLARFLLSNGYPQEFGEVVENRRKMNVSQKKRRSVASWYSKELRDFVRRREALIFELFPEYDAWPP